MTTPSLPSPSPRRPPVVQTIVLVALLAFLIGTFGGPVAGVAGAVGTAAHEAGHAVVADLLTGDVASITVFPDGGGVAVSEASSSGWRRFLVAGAGYPSTLFAALALLSAVFFAPSARGAAIGGAVASLVVWVLYVPFSSVVDSIPDGDQRFTWFLLGAMTVAFAVIAVLPDRYDQPRRIGLGLLAAGLLTDAFGAGSDLVTIEDVAGATRTDADGLAEAASFGSATFWAWSLRGSLFVIAGAWVILAVRAATPPATGLDDS